MEREIIKLRNLYEERVVKQTISFNLYQSLYDNQIENKNWAQLTAFLFS